MLPLYKAYNVTKRARAPSVVTSRKAHNSTHNWAFSKGTFRLQVGSPFCKRFMRMIEATKQRRRETLRAPRSNVNILRPFKTLLLPVPDQAVIERTTVLLYHSIILQQLPSKREGVSLHSSLGEGERECVLPVFSFPE